MNQESGEGIVMKLRQKIQDTTKILDMIKCQRFEEKNESWNEIQAVFREIVAVALWESRGWSAIDAATT